jgi:hypothetical protein
VLLDAIALDALDALAAMPPEPTLATLAGPLPVVAAPPLPLELEPPCALPGSASLAHAHSVIEKAMVVRSAHRKSASMDRPILRAPRRTKLARRVVSAAGTSTDIPRSYYGARAQ